MIVTLWTAVLLFIIAQTSELPAPWDAILIFISLAFYTVTYLWWDKYRSRILDLEDKVEALTQTVIELRNENKD